MGQYGSALWIDAVKPWMHNEDKPVTVTVKMCTMMVDTPRLLLVRIASPFHVILCVVAHAAHIDDTVPNATKHFWAEAEAQTILYSKDVHSTLVMTDANAQLASTMSMSVDMRSTFAPTSPTRDAPNSPHTLRSAIHSCRHTSRQRREGCKLITSPPKERSE